jgi:hypothetical protein
MHKNKTTNIHICTSLYSSTMCICVCEAYRQCVSDREAEKERKRERERDMGDIIFISFYGREFKSL